MERQPGTFEQLVTLLAGMFAPLRERIDDAEVLELLAELGIQFPASLASDASFTSPLNNIASLTHRLPAVVKALIVAIEADDRAQVLQLTIDVIRAARDLIIDIRNIAAAIDAKKTTFPGLTPAEVGAFATDLPKRLLDYLIVRQVEDGMRPIASALDLAGIFTRTEENAGSTDPLRPPITKREVKLAAIPDFLTSPGAVLQTLYGWGSNAFDGRALLQKLETLALENGLPAVYTDTGVPTLDVMFLELQPKTDVTPPGLRVLVHTLIKAADSVTLDDPRWQMTFGSDVRVPVGSVIVLQPDGTFALTPPPPVQIQGRASAAFRTTPAPGSSAFVLIGDADKSRLEFQTFGAAAAMQLASNPVSGQAPGDFSIGAEVKGGQLLIDLSGSDGFIAQLLSNIRVAAPFEFALGFSTQNGFYFRGSSGLEIQIPVHVDLAVVEIPSLTLGAGLTSAGIPVTLGADIKANLGPLVAVVENMGMKATFAFSDDHDGNLGPLDLQLAFKPPNGVGLSIDAGVVRGGGFLRFDFDKEEYAGILELAIAELVTVKAIGLITTRLPDGSKGFSLLLIITAEFSGLQLGLGFTLNALGGLLGLNRTMMLGPLAEGIRTGAIESVMFPRDVIANAPRIISDLKVFFPPLNGVFLIGPMAKIGWGTPALITLSVGVIIEIPPGNIAIVGVLRVMLPDKDAALLVLQVNFIGALEAEKDRLWFYAALFESRVLFMPLDGEMGVLVAWGVDANLVVSVGGFHPAFNPPPLPFPDPKRIALSLLSEPLARVRVDGYFTVTSNTAQFGARVEVFFGLSHFNVNGHLAFDALFQFSPFYFVITMSASLGVKVFGVGLFSVRFRGQLEGPTPWHIQGEGSISLFFFDIDVPFSHTWGQEADTTLLPIQVMPLLAAELDKIDNWKASTPSSSQLLVSLRQLQAVDGLVMHPLGTLRVSQRAVPLDLVLDKIGNQTPGDVNHLSIAVESSLSKRDDANELFATAQFKKLGDSQKLSTPAFEPQHAGVELSVAGRQVRFDRPVRRTVRYETQIIDSNFKRFTRFVGFLRVLFHHFMDGNAASKSTLSYKTRQQRVPIDNKVAVSAPAYGVASMKDNTAFDGGSTGFTSRAKANDYMRDQIRRNPKLATGLHVIPATETREAA